MEVKKREMQKREQRKAAIVLFFEPWTSSGLFRLKSGRFTFLPTLERDTFVRTIAWTQCNEFEKTAQEDPKQDQMDNTLTGAQALTKRRLREDPESSHLRPNSPRYLSRSTAVVHEAAN